MSLSTHGRRPLSTLPLMWRRLLLLGGAATVALLVAASRGALAQDAANGHTSEQCEAESKAAAADAKKAMAVSKIQPAAKRALSQAPPAAKAPAPKTAAASATKGAPRKIVRTLTTVRGELVDYYCYIERGARGPEHRDCAIRCVAGDVCMGILTPDGKTLMMLSVNHMRAMEPLAWRDIPDPFQTCRGLLSETVDLTGYVMERRGQKIIEVTAVKVVPKSAKPVSVFPKMPPNPKPGPGVVLHSTKRAPVTLRGELVDFYCFIEKGATGPEHRDCAVRCVAGDVCMGLLTTDKKTLMMLSVNHLRAMDPKSWRGIPDPFTTCRGLLAENVDLTGYVMERHGQKIIEVTEVRVIPKGAVAASARK